MPKKPLEIDCIAGSQLRDTQGEMLSVEGADISELASGKGRWNDNHGKGFFNSIGRITTAKKIFKSEDCEDDRQRYYWDKVKVPFIYARGFLYDDEDHPNAKAAAAILRNIHKADAPLQIKASVEGGVVARGISDPSLLARTKIHSVALTFTPANNNTLVEPISLDKSGVDEVADEMLIKSVIHLAQTNVPSFRHIVRDASASKVQGNLNKIAEILNSMGVVGDITFPTKKEIIEHSLEKKIHANVAKIHEIIAATKNEDLEKNWKKVLGGAMLAGAAMTPSKLDSPAPQPSAIESKQAQAPDMSKHAEVYRRVAKEYPILGAIGLKESSGAQNYNHKPISNKNSLHTGHTAGGMFGMMPNSAAFVLKKDPELAKKYPQLVEAAKDVSKNHTQFTELFNKDPEAAADFAISLYKRNKSKTKNPEMLVHSWLNGLKGSWNAYKDKGMGEIQSHPYVKDIMQYYNAEKAKQKQPVKDKKPAAQMQVIKALTAGYGGAGAPSGRVAGAVLQAESLDGGRIGFKYATCDKCGKEQVYAKHQVKCRECGQNWSLETLHKIMFGSK